VLLSQLLNLISKSLIHLQDGEISGSSLSDGTNCVAASSLEEDVSDLLVSDVVRHGVLGLVGVDLNNISLPEGGHSHLVLSESSSLIRANVVGSTHDLTGSESLDEVLLNEHLSHRVGEGDDNSEWESFRDSDNDDSDTNNNVLKPPMEVSTNVVRPVKANGTLLDEESDEENEHSQGSSKHTKVTNVLSDSLQLHLKRSLFNVSVKLVHDLPLTRVSSYDKGQKPTFSSLNLGT